MGRFYPGHVFVMIDRGDYWQCAFVIPKGGFDEVKRRGLDALREEGARGAPFMRERGSELSDWDHGTLLPRPRVRDDRPRRLLAVRLRDPQGRVRRGQAPRTGRLARGGGAGSTIHARARERAIRLGPWDASTPATCS